MKCIKEELIEATSDRESIKRLSIIANNYPTAKGYAIECWISVSFINIKVYDINKVESKDEN